MMSTGGTQNVGGISASLDIDLAVFDAQMRAAGQKMEDVRAKLAALDAAMKSGTVGPQAYAKALADLQAEEQAVIAAAGDLQAALGRAASSTINVGAANARLSTGMAQTSRESRQMAAGLTQIAYFTDDMAYGFRALVNQMPMVGQAMGQAFGLGTAESQKLGAALGIGAAAVRTWQDNWESFRDVMADTGWLDTLDGKIKQLKESLTDPEVVNSSWFKALQGFAGPLGGLLPGLGVKDDVEKAKAERKADEADRKAAVAAIGQMKTPEAEATGRAIREQALSLPGGPQGLLDQLAAQNTPANATKQQRETTRGQVARMLRDAMAGDVNAQQGLFATAGPDFTEAVQARSPQAKAAAKQAAKAQEQQQKDEDDFIAQDQRESQRRYEATLRRRKLSEVQSERSQQADVNERARQLAGGELGLRSLSQTEVTEADVRQRLGQAGLTPQQVEAQAGPVFAGFTKMMQDQIQGRAIQEGVGLDRARAELLAERIDKANDDPNKLRKAEDPEDLMRQLLRLRLDAQPEARGMEFVAPAEMAARVQMAANQPEDRSLRAMLDVAENTAEQVKILEKIQGGVPAVAT
jgi:PIN domain nuclease of toxin-antitoxin system